MTINPVAVFYGKELDFTHPAQIKKSVACHYRPPGAGKNTKPSPPGRLNYCVCTMVFFV